MFIHHIFSGVLEANYIEPTHNKQDFEKTSLFQKLETRLRDMQYEYWWVNFHWVKSDRICSFVMYLGFFILFIILVESF